MVVTFAVFVDVVVEALLFDDVDSVAGVFDVVAVNSVLILIVFLIRILIILLLM